MSLRAWWWSLRYYWAKPVVRYAVITKLPADADGNECDDFMCKLPTCIGWGPDGDLVEDVWHTTNDYDPNKKYERVRLPVFSLGEILLVNRSGREIAGRGRKPDKWDVECEYFWTRRAALKRAKEVIR